MSRITGLLPLLACGVPLALTAAGCARAAPPRIGGAQVSWVYHDGRFAWAGDWSFNASPDYRDESGAPRHGGRAIKITGRQWGGWQPYISGRCNATSSACFDTRPYRYFIFSAKATHRNQAFGVGFMSANDTTDGPGVANAGAYCSGGSDPPVGQWENCRIPLSAFGLTNPLILKFHIQDQTGLQANVWYLDDVGFE